jgi:hypothetical protein
MQQTNCFIITAQRGGNPVVVSHINDPGQSDTDKVEWDSLHDAESVAAILDEAEKRGLSNVRVHHVLVGDELSGDEITTLRASVNGGRS